MEGPPGDAGPDAPPGTPDASTDANPNAPGLVSTTPASGATAVSPATAIVLVFTRPMNQASVQAAWISSDLPAASMTFTWNAAGDTLTATPNSELPVAEIVGLDPGTTAPLTVGFTIGAGATDTGGVALAPFSVQFTTMRRLKVELVPVQSLTNSVFNDGTAVDPPGMSVGDSQVNAIYWRMLVTFTLPDPPAGAVLERATFSGDQISVAGTPYAVLGTLGLAHVTYTALDLNAFGVAPHSPPGILSTTADLGIKTLAVTSQVADDYTNKAARSGRSQYRLEFATPTINDATQHRADFGNGGVSNFRLALAFLIE